MRVSADQLVAPFTAFIAHELRTPLATQRALLELSLSDLDADAAAWREIARDMSDACKQQERLLEACLALSQSQGGTGQGEVVEIGSLVAGMLRRADLEGLGVRVRLEPTLTRGVPRLIERLVDNLLANAVRHNRAGGWIALTTGRGRSGAQLMIENTGDRIPDSELARLFEPFEQLFSPKTGSADGFGLGLAIVRAVAEAHDALVTARARPAGGLRIQVTFPHAQDA